MSAPMHCPHCGGEVRFASLPLTPKQFALLQFIDRSVTERGVAPSFDEIAAEFKYRSLATVHEHLANLERKGAIRREYCLARGITVLADVKSSRPTALASSLPGGRAR